LTLDEWIRIAAAELGVEPLGPQEQRLVLDMARDVAHNMLRPGAPLCAYLIGLAVGRGASLTDAARAVSAAAHRHARPAEAGP
jgi:hypothetical protein